MGVQLALACGEKWLLHGDLMAGSGWSRLIQLRQSFHQFTRSVLGNNVGHRSRCHKARHKDGNVFIGIEALRLDVAEAEGAVGSRHEAVDVRNGGAVREKRLEETAKPKNDEPHALEREPKTPALKIRMVDFLPRAELEACQRGPGASLASGARH